MSRDPSFVYYPKGTEETLVGEFHFGSASDEEVLQPNKGIKLFLTDPPYNLGFDYGEVSDNQPEEDYHQMMEDVVDACYEAADDDAHMFLIHYPQDFAKMWPRLTKKWKFHQWITWAYPANFGHSTKKWTNASRTILWLVKGTPEFYGDRVVQPYKNPWDRRIKKLIHEEGKIGTPLYNWWQVNLCKNISKDKKEYSNQIPEELLERIVLSTTNLGDLVADPFSGTFSTSRTAMRLGRRAWGCDLNPHVIKWRPTLTDYNSEPKIVEPKYDREYPFYKFEEAGLTIEQIHKISAHLLETLSPEEIAKAPGIGIAKAKKMKEALQGKADEEGTVQTGIESFSKETGEND
jgi:adenine-specific DNA-methyltransferase